MEKQIDILIVGAGISGIGLAAHLSKHCPQRSFEIIERRASIGGTWDLFKYPGIRSDSASIKGYLAEVVDEFNLESKIHYQHRVLTANYDSTT